VRRRWSGLLLPLLLLVPACTSRAEPAEAPAGGDAVAPFADCAGLTAAPTGGTPKAAAAGTSPAAPVGGTPAAAASTGAGAVATDLPDLRLPCFTGGAQVAVADLRGPAVINLWASWCPPCREELPALQRLAQRAAGQVHVIGVNSKDRPAAAASIGADFGLTFPNLVDPDQQVQRAVAPNVLPVTLLVDADGRIRHTVVSGALDDDRLTDLLRRHLGVTVPA
jgi:thiol-disulfide isomerase/thioredoxin